AEEIARQLRLRDLAGLIVIDFIDMDERRNNRLVERRLKESLRNDRARIQVGRISHFGLLEMSRQRLRTGMLEGSTTSCPICQGTGIVRSVESVALDILRSIEDRLITDGVMPLVATTAVDVALYILNQKRSHLKDIEYRYKIPVTVTANQEMHISQFVIERPAEGAHVDGEGTVVHMDWAHHREEGAALPAPAAAPTAEQEGEQGRRRSRRRRRKRHGEGSTEFERLPVAARSERAEEDEEDKIEDMAVLEAGAEGAAEAGSDSQVRRSPRRRGRRGGRRGRSGQRPQQPGGEPRHVDDAQGGAAASGGEAQRPEAQAETPAPARDESANGRAREPRAPKNDEVVAAGRPRREPEPKFSVAAAREKPDGDAALVESEGQPEAPRRRGWWSR
ncbi:MAG: ribonuclease E/G, partial [Methyloceanibacter sp.]